MANAGDGDRQQPQPPRWNGIQSLDLVHELNVRCIQLLVQVAERDVQSALPCVQQNADIWKRLSEGATQRLASLPFLLLDMNFRNASWWSSVLAAGTPRDAVETTGVELPEDFSRQMAHEVVLFAWQTARWDRTVARMTLAMQSTVCNVVASLTPRQILEVASRKFGVLTVRWGDDAGFWREMILAADSEDLERHADLRLHAGLKLCTEILRAEGVGQQESGEPG